MCGVENERDKEKRVEELPLESLCQSRKVAMHGLVSSFLRQRSAELVWTAQYKCIGMALHCKILDLIRIQWAF